MNKKNNKGFSLVELIVVIAIMAVLVGVLAPALLRYVEKSRAQKDASAAEEIRNAVEIALAQEDCYAEVSDGEQFAIESGDDLATVFASQVSGDSEDNLANEVVGTVGDSVDFTSNTYKDETYTIEITIDSTTQNVKVEGTWGTTTNPDEGG